MQMIPGALSRSLAIVLATACSTVVHKQPAAGDVESRELSALELTWFRGTLESDQFRHYLTIPEGSAHLARIPRRALSRMAMVESFMGDANWERIRCNPINFVRFDRVKIPQGEDSRGLEAGVFAHIEEQRSHPFPLNPINWLEDTAGYDLNAYSTCAEWLAERTRSYMVQEWERLSRFRRNTAIRDLASRCREVTTSRDGSEEFSRLVEHIRACQRRFSGHELLQTSVHKVLGDRSEARQFEIRFFDEYEALDHYVWSMTGIRPKYVNHDGVPFMRVPRWPHLVSMEGASSYLDKIEELFALLETNRTGEVDMKYAKFLVVRGDYSSEIEQALPPYTRLGLVPGKRLLVAKVLNENLGQARMALGGASR